MYFKRCCCLKAGVTRRVVCQAKDLAESGAWLLVIRLSTSKRCQYEAQFCRLDLLAHKIQKFYYNYFIKLSVTIIDYLICVAIIMQET